MLIAPKSTAHIKVGQR